jgi:prevent-host-death family protein
MQNGGSPMDTVTVKDAKEQLEELLEKAARGEDVRISDAKHGTVRLTSVRAPDTTTPRATDAMAPFVPLPEDRVPGRLKGKMKVPARLMDPMSEDELKDWYGDDA